MISRIDVSMAKNERMAAVSSFVEGRMTKAVARGLMIHPNSLMDSFIPGSRTTKNSTTANPTKRRRVEGYISQAGPKGIAAKYTTNAVVNKDKKGRMAKYGARVIV
jgi:hypothetical protein